MPKKGQYGLAPYIGLDDAIGGITAFYRQYGDKGSRDFLADTLDNTPKSSSFVKKVAALKAYGLLNETNGDVRLSTLALSIVAPTRVDEPELAKTEAFFSVPLLKKLHEKLRGGLLPKSEMLVNLLAKEFAILPKYAETWVMRFEESLRTVGLLSRKGTGWMIMDKPVVSQVETPPVEEEKVAKKEIKADQGEWREYTHPLGNLRIKVDAPKHVVNEFINFLRFVILSENGKEKK